MIYKSNKTEIPVYLNKEQKELLERFRKLKMKNLTQALKNFSKAKSFGIINNGIRVSNSKIFLLAVLFLVLPALELIQN